MRIHTPVLIALTLMASSAGAVSAQDYIAQCRDSAANDADRIACLENAVRQLQGETEPPAPDTPAEIAESAEAPVAPTAPSGIGAEQVVAEQEKKAEREPGAKKPKQEDVTVAVADYAVAANGEYILFLENGHVWRQKGKPNARLRLYQGKNYTVTIRKGALSGYRITINEVRRTFTAKRVK